MWWGVDKDDIKEIREDKNLRSERISQRRRGSA